MKKLGMILAAMILVAGLAYAGTTNFDTVQCTTLEVRDISPITAGAGTGSKVMLPFVLTNGVTSAATSVLYVAGENATATWEAAFPGSIVGIAVRANAVQTIGAKTFYVYLNGTQKLGTTMATGEVIAYNYAAPGLYPFNAGATIEARYSTTGDLQPTTVDNSIAVYVTQ